VKVIDRTEHPPLQPGKPVVVYPGSIGGLNFSPAAYDPKTNYIFNAAAETAAVMIQKKLTPTQKKRKRLQGDIFLGLQNGDFGQYLPGWHDHGSISAIDVNTGRRVWKFLTPEPERGGVSITASGIGSPAAATATSAPSISRRESCCGSSRPGGKSRPGLRSTRSPARSTSRSRSAARRRRRTAASCPD
jgi:hypothetical protein